MFSEICKSHRESIYGVLCQTPTAGGQIIFGNGTAFMIAPGICATAAHVLHLDGKKDNALHKKIEVIRAPDVGQPMLQATLIAEDIDRDLALIRISTVGHQLPLRLLDTRMDMGHHCGSLGFPLAKVVNNNGNIAFNLTERFQGAYISAFQYNFEKNRPLHFYETDALMYGGSSGCPGFTTKGDIFGMHVATITDGNSTSNSSRLAISLWVPSMDIIEFAMQNNTNGLELA